MAYTSSAVAAMETHRTDAGVVQSGIQLLKNLSMAKNNRVSGSGVFQTLAIVGRRERERESKYALCRYEE
jgi:hypothetical protein